MLTKSSMVDLRVKKSMRMGSSSGGIVDAWFVDLING